MHRFATTVLMFFTAAGHSQQNYPNIDGETLLEDDRVVVQRFILY